MEKEVACEQFPPLAQEKDERHMSYDMDGEMGLGTADIQRIEKVYR